MKMTARAARPAKAHRAAAEKPKLEILSGPPMLSQLVREHFQAAGWQAASRAAGPTPAAEPAASRNDDGGEAQVLLWLWQGGAQELDMMRQWAKSGTTQQLLVVGNAQYATFARLEEELILMGAGGCAGEHEGLQRLQTMAASVAAGEACFSGTAYRRVIARLRAGDAAAHNPAPELALTSRERDILRAIERGLCNKEISCELGLALSTVKAHIQNLFKKFGVNNRLGLLLRALKG